MKNQIAIILFKILPSNRFSKAKSYNFHFHTNDVTWPLSANGPLENIPKNQALIYFLLFSGCITSTNQCESRKKYLLLVLNSNNGYLMYQFYWVVVEESKSEILSLLHNLFVHRSWGTDKSSKKISEKKGSNPIFKLCLGLKVLQNQF